MDKLDRFNGLPQAKVLECLHRVCKEIVARKREEVAKETDLWFDGYDKGYIAAVSWINSTLDLVIALEKGAAEKKTAEAVQEHTCLDCSAEAEELQGSEAQPEEGY